MPSRIAADASIGASSAFVVQKKSTPFRNPRNSGGSPSGVSAPPMLPTRKMKKTTTCVRCRRASLARSSGRIISIDAPVVPITLASTGAYRQQCGVDERRPVQVAADVDAAGRGEEGQQQQHERYVLGQQRVHDLLRGRRRPDAAAYGTSSTSAQNAATLP